MKKSDIKMAYNSVSASGELKEKVFARLEAEYKKSYKNLKQGGSHKFTAAAICVSAAMVAVVFLIRHCVHSGKRI